MRKLLGPLDTGSCKAALTITAVLTVTAAQLLLHVISSDEVHMAWQRRSGLQRNTQEALADTMSQFTACHGHDCLNVSSCFHIAVSLSSASCQLCQPLDGFRLAFLHLLPDGAALHPLFQGLHCEHCGAGQASTCLNSNCFVALPWLLEPCELKNFSSRL